MTKMDMVILIECFEAWERMNALIGELTGGYIIDNPKYSIIDQLTEIIRKNSRYPGTSDSDIDALNLILFDENINAEEKYEQIKPITLDSSV